MLQKILKSFLKLYGYQKVKQPFVPRYSILNSKEFILEERQNRQSIYDFIKRLSPYYVGKKLVRLGPNKDGGYLVPDDLDGIGALFSPGVSSVSGFEKDCSQRGIKLFLADKSVSGANLEVEHHFTKKFIGCTNNENFITMGEWVNSSIGNDVDLMLQMDIEGYEYMTFINMEDVLLRRFRIIVVEFHDLHKLWNKSNFGIITTVFQKILQTHVCVHIHPNNHDGLDVQEGIEIPRLAEFTFIRKDRVNEKIPCTVFPHQLDVDCTNYPSIILPEMWYK